MSVSKNKWERAKELLKEPGVQIALLLFALTFSVTTYGIYSLPPIESFRDLTVLHALLTLFSMFLYTGLFITAHDAMHGTVSLKSQHLNFFLGQLCIRFYALFSYEQLMKLHFAHHYAPTSPTDPDYKQNENDSFFRWYFRFLSHLVPLKQLGGMALEFAVVTYFFQAPVINSLLFWVLPSGLSTLQVFYFGTYLPHRSQAGQALNAPHFARSRALPSFFSLITCYHFGAYHLEHHENPSVSWWSLTKIRNND